MRIKNWCVFAVVAALVASSSFGQTNLNFNNIYPTTEKAIILSWNSTSNEVYEIDYADALDTNSDGTTAWNALYADYPSHGTNTFIADAGNYDNAPEIPHPKLSPMRYYRVMLVQTNDSPSNPVVALTSPTNGASLSGDVTIQVASSTSDILSQVKLYVDGEEQWSDGDGTNFVINTCEWPAGPHTLFATAKSQSGYEGVANGGVITYGRAVSPYVNVTFNNLITRFDFSQPFFEPSLGQTQNVTASFAANVNWTLEIQDVSSNDVLSVSGSGTNMAYAWDGTGTNGAIPDGIYSYLLTVTTNGGTFTSVASPGGSSGGAPSPSFASFSSSESAPTQLLVAAGDSAVPFAIYPPGFDTNGLTIFEGSLSDFAPAESSTASMAFAADSLDGGALDGFSGSSQSTRGPKRKPKVGNKNLAGTFGQLFRTYDTNGFVSPHPLSGLPSPLRTRVGIDGQGTTELTSDYRLFQFTTVAVDFAAVMKKAAWKSAFLKSDKLWTANTIMKSSLGGDQIFENCNFGMLMGHGSFANSGQTEADGVIKTYYWMGANSQVRLPDMLFGQFTGTNHLKWMTLFACNLLRPANFTSMANNSQLPIGNGLHLLLGSETFMYVGSIMGKLYASNLVAGVTIENSWYNTANVTYALNPKGITNTVTLRVVGQANCFSDTIYANQDPDPNAAFTIDHSTVFTYP